MLVLASEATAITALVCGVWMAVNDKQGWGWFLLVSLLSGVSFKSGGDSNGEK